MIGVVLTIVAAALCAGFGVVVGAGIAGSTPGPVPEFDESSLKDAVSRGAFPGDAASDDLDSLLDRSREIVRAIWDDRVVCESKVAAVFVACCLFTVGWVFASLRTSFTGEGTYFAVFSAASCGFWAAYFRTRHASEEKRLAGIAASETVARLEAIKESMV